MDNKQKKALKARAHALKPVVMIAAKGLSEAVLAETNLALEAHELIKVKISGHEREARAKIGEDLCHELDATLVQSIGNTLIVYRKNPKK